MSFAKELPDGPPFRARGFLAAQGARTLARDLIAMTQEEFSRAYKTSPMKRARLRRGLKRNTAMVLGNVKPSSGFHLPPGLVAPVLIRLLLPFSVLNLLKEILAMLSITSRTGPLPALEPAIHD